jgi:hypothetical protein
MITRKPASKAQTTELSPACRVEARFRPRRARFKGTGRPPEFEGASWDRLRDAINPPTRSEGAAGWLLAVRILVRIDTG